MKTPITKEQLLTDLKNKRSIIPNILSGSRAFAPIVILSFTFGGNWIGTLLSTGLFALTDLFDGMIARKTKGETKLGGLIDAVCDKIFSIGILLPLIPSFPPLALTAILESTIAFINSKSFVNGGNPATIFQGKVKTALLSTTVVSQCMSVATSLPVFSVLTPLLLTATTALEVKNIADYKKIADNSSFDNSKTSNPEENIEPIEEKEYEISEELQKQQLELLSNCKENSRQKKITR